VDEYDRDISQEEIIKVSNFFDSLNFGSSSMGGLEGIEQQIPFEAFMEVIDLGDKWMNDGSGAYPPCVKRVPWQVIRKVYPIEYKHMWNIR